MVVSVNVCLQFDVLVDPNQNVFFSRICFSVHLVSILITNYPVKKWNFYQKASGNLNGSHLPLTCQIADGKERVKISLMYVFYNLLHRKNIVAKSASKPSSYPLALFLFYFAGYSE